MNFRAEPGESFAEWERRQRAAETNRILDSDEAAHCECGSTAFDQCGFCGRCGCYRADHDHMVGIHDDVLEAAASERAEAFKELIVDG